MLQKISFCKPAVEEQKSKLVWSEFVYELREAENQTTVGLVEVGRLQHAAQLRLHSWKGVNCFSGRNAHCISSQGVQYTLVPCICFFPLFS